jgi:hypothetical protein
MLREYAQHDSLESSGKANLKPSDPLVALVLLLIPLMLLVLSLPPYRGNAGLHKVDYALSGAAIAAVVAGIVWFKTRSTLPLMLLGVALLLIANIAWGKAFRLYASTHNYFGEVFRRPMQQSLHAPMYGRYDNALIRMETLPFAILSFGVAGAWYVWARRRKWEQSWTPTSLALLIGFALAMIILFAACEPWPSRFSLNISGYAEFKKDIPAFDGVRDTLRHYVERMPALQWYGQHYPPGNLILLEIEKQLGLTGMTKTIVCLCTILSIIPLWKLARELELDPVATSATLFLFAATWGVLIYCTINTTSLLLLPGTMCLLLLMRALKSGSVTAALGLGVWFVLYMFFSFSASILGVLMALTTLIGLWRGAFTLANVIRTGNTSLATLACVIAGLYGTAHFNLIACFIAAVRGHHAGEGFDDASRWLLRSTGNVIAYLVSIAPLFILGLSAALRGKDGLRSPRGVLFLALLATVLIAAFSGLFYVETERIWIFLTPVFALAAGWELSRRARIEGPDLLSTVFLLVLLIGCTQEWLFMHYR